MKKFLMMLLAALLVIGMFSVAALAEEWNPSDNVINDALDTPTEPQGPAAGCQHRQTYQVQVNYPTCTETGSIEEHCTDCNMKVRESAVNPLGHEMLLQNEVAPTCTVDGNRHYVCGNPGCTYTEDKAIKAPGHGWVWIRVVEEDTCTTAGYDLYKCLVCEEYKTETVDVVKHIWHGEETVEPTCTKAGYTVEECSICLTTKTTEVPAVGHKWSAWDIDEVPSCTQAGLKSRYCLNPCCYDAYLGAHVKETEVIKAHGHKVLRGTETAATCTTAGTIAGTCVYCSESVVLETAPATGHAWGEWTAVSETLEERVCKNGCGEKETRELVVVEPEQPVDPEKPSEGDKEEDKPATKPETDKSESADNGDVVIPATGDNSTIAPYIMMMLAAAGLVVLAVSKRKVNG